MHSVTRIEAQAGQERAQVHIRLARTARVFQCSGCGQACTQVHEVVRRCVRDLPILDADTYVWFSRYRVACPTCGPGRGAPLAVSLGARDGPSGGQCDPGVQGLARPGCRHLVRAVSAIL